MCLQALAIIGSGQEGLALRIAFAADEAWMVMLSVSDSSFARNSATSPSKFLQG